MKNRKNRSTAILWGIVLLGFVAVSKVKSNTAFYGAMVNQPILAYSTTVVMDLNARGIDRLSAQISISSVAIAACTFTDGGQSTGSITISSFSSLVGARAYANLTVASNSATDGDYAKNVISLTSGTVLAGMRAGAIITVSSTVNASSAILTFTNQYNSFTIGASNQFLLGASSNATAVNIANFFNSGNYGVSAATSVSAGTQTVVLTVNNVGTYGNRYFITSSSPFALSVTSFGASNIQGAYFQQGQDPVTLTLNSYISVTGGVDYAVSAFSTQTAYNLAQELNGKDYGIVATTGTFVNGSSVALVLSQVGATYNGYTLTSSSQQWLNVVSTPFFGGADPVTFGINGVNLKNGSDWFMRNTATDTALSIVFAISSNAALSQIVTASTLPNNAGAVLVTAISSGTAYWYPTYTSSQTAITLTGVSSTWSGSTLSALANGWNNAYLNIAGFQFVQGVDFFASTSNQDTAQSIRDAMANNSTFTKLILSTWTKVGTTGVITATSVYDGSYFNFAMITSSQAAMSLSGNIGVRPILNNSGAAISTMTGGQPPTYSTTTSVISLPNNRFVTGLAVVLSTTANTIAPAPLAFGSTYFVMSIDSTNIQLAGASTAAVAGTFIPLVSITTQSAAHTFTLTPVPNAGTSMGWFQVSNDTSNLNWTNLVSVPTITFVTPYASSTTYTDIGVINARYLRFQTIIATAGAVNLSVIVNGKN